MLRNHQAGPRLAAVACIALLAVSISPLVNVARADLPPRPNPPAPAGSGGGKSPAGAQIVLRAAFDPGWPWDRVHWQELWTVVEWQSAEGTWHIVEGWQGTLDRIGVEENGDVGGEKAWWVYEPNLGQGPFRWLVYEERDGRLIAASDSFYLPEHINQQSTIEISLAR
jgi:hypothetical protein